MRVRIPAILDSVLERNPDYAPKVRDSIWELRDAMPCNLPLPKLDGALPYAETWTGELGTRAGETWLATDWLFAETYAYRQLVDRARFWSTERDPFSSYKMEEYESDGHAMALQHALSLSGPDEERLLALLGAALWGNRIDLSFAASRVRGMASEPDDLLADDREAAVRLAFAGSGPIHVVADNAGTELTMDLALADFCLERLSVPVVVHVKVHPTFVSDATAADVLWFLNGSLAGSEAGYLARLRDALQAGKLEIAPHPFWNSPRSLRQMPEDLDARFAQARLVLLKGDANYRRALDDALWPAETPFATVTSYFPAPLLALRTLKSDPLVGLAPGKLQEQCSLDPSFRVNGKRGLASLGGSRLDTGRSLR